MTEKKLHIDLVPSQMFTGADVTFDISIIGHYGDDVEDEREADGTWNVPDLEASIINGQLKLRQTELIEPSEWPVIVATMMTAIEQARDFAEADWPLDGKSRDFKAFISVASKTGTRQEKDDQPEEGEPKALRIDYRIMDGQREVQTGMVDWQNGLYVWDSPEPFDFWELPVIGQIISSICEQCKLLMVDVRCWS